MQDNKKRIVKNSIFLYIRMFFITILTLYTSRVVLAELGVEDFGIYNIVGGIVMMLGFFNSSMSVATQRYMSFDIGKGDSIQLNKTFNSSLLIYLFIAILIVLLLETVGLWYINYKLVVPSDQIFTVNVVYQFTVLTFLVNITQLPYNALILAKEKMQVYAYVSLLDTILKLGILYLLFLSDNKLILYSVLVFIVTVIVQVIYHIYCHNSFPETKIKLVRDKVYLKELLTFSGWNLFGNIASMARSQGINLLLNLFFGVILNASYAIAMQVQNAVLSFVMNFQKAINPQIIKSYAINETNRAINLMNASCKYSFFLILIMGIPLLIHTDYIIALWLGEKPLDTVQFVQLSIVVGIVESISGPLMTMFQATGKIKLYQIVVGTLVFLNLPLSYLFLKITNQPEIIYLVMLVISVLSLIARVYLLKRIIIDFSFKHFFKEVLLRILIVSLFIYVLYFITKPFIKVESLLNLAVLIALEIIIILAGILIIGVNSSEKKLVIKFIKKRFNIY